MNKKAVALKYDKIKDKSPKVTAKGKNEIATKIIKLAKENNIPIKEDKDLVEILSKIELNENIPPKLYQAVSEVFLWLYKITKE